MASHNSMSATECADLVFSGNAAALEAAEQEAERLADLWLQWFRKQDHGVPASFRLDFLCTSKGKLSTIELCECGGSLCGLSANTRAAACLNDCLKDSSTLAPVALGELKVLYEGQPASSNSWGNQNGNNSYGNNSYSNSSYGNSSYGNNSYGGARAGNGLALARSSRPEPSGLSAAIRSIFGKGRLAVLVVVVLLFLRLRKKF